MPNGHDTIHRWLESVARDPSPYRFMVTDLTERRNPVPDIVGALAEIVARTKANLEVIEAMAGALGRTDALARLQPGRVGIRRGDFGEAICCEILEATLGLTVPIRKLRYQTDPEQTMHGTDIVGFRFDESGTLSDLHFVECKLRTYRALAIGTEAHDQLAKDRSEGYADSLMFLADRISETDPQLFGSFQRYLASRDRIDRGSYGVMLVFDAEHWDEEILERVEEIQDQLTPLHTQVILVTSVRDLVDLVCECMGACVIDDAS